MNEKQFTNILLRSSEARLELASVDIQFFAEYYLAKYFNFPTPQFHIDWIEYFTNYDRVALACPRGSAKTTWWSLVFPLWCILFQKKQFIILFSDTKDQANGFLGSIIEELETNETIIKDFGKIAGYVPPTAQEKKTWTASTIVTTTNIR